MLRTNIYHWLLKKKERYSAKCFVCIFLISSYYNLIICFMGKEAEAEGQLTGIMSQFLSENTLCSQTLSSIILLQNVQIFYLEFYDSPLYPAIVHLLITHSLPIPYPQNISIMEAVGKEEDSRWPAGWGWEEYSQGVKVLKRLLKGNNKGCSVNKSDPTDRWT